MEIQSLVSYYVYVLYLQLDMRMGNGAHYILGLTRRRTIIAQDMMSELNVSITIIMLYFDAHKLRSVNTNNW